MSACDFTETYSPAAIDIAPATVPARPIISTVAAGAPALATPTTMPATDTMPSLAPSTAAAQPTHAVGTVDFRVAAVRVQVA